MEDEFEVM